MLPIPKELQNTKAIPFMEWYIKYYIDYEGSTDEILNFLNQSFTPEMLQEYFEGWEDFHFENDKADYRLFCSNGKCWITEHNDIAIHDNTWYLDSLDSFITLCNLAGVNLTWKGDLND